MSKPQHIIVVTGAAGGIGREIVRELLRSRTAEHGDATILELDREWRPDLPSDPTLGTAPAPEADLIFESARASGTLTRGTLDVSNEPAVHKTFAQIAESGLLRAVVHAAGILGTGPAVETTAEHTRRIFEVNALGAIWVAQHAAKVMTSQNPNDFGVNARSITTIASNAGNGPRAGFSVYGAAKAAASSYTRSLGLELGPHGIRCNVVSPGTTQTQMVADMWDGADRSSESVKGDPHAYRTGIPLGRIAQPSDIAQTVDFLVSERARHITLADLTVDGGATQR